MRSGWSWTAPDGGGDRRARAAGRDARIFSRVALGRRPDEGPFRAARSGGAGDARVRLGHGRTEPLRDASRAHRLALLTLDEIAPGRASLVLGAGGDLAATLGLPPRGGSRRSRSASISFAPWRPVARSTIPGFITGSQALLPWSRVQMDRVYLGANRPRMLRLAARKADGVMVTDMPAGYVGPLIARVRAELAQAGRDPRPFTLSNWFVWNVQETERRPCAWPAGSSAFGSTTFETWRPRSARRARGARAGETTARDAPGGVPGTEPWSPPLTSPIC